MQSATATAASPSGCSSFLTMFCDRFHAHVSQLGDDQDEAFVRACTYRHSPFRSFVQNAIGTKETVSDSVIGKAAHSPDLAAIRKDVVGLVQCMTNEQLIDVLCNAVPHFRQLWLSAQASSFGARQRLLQEVDELTFETTLNLMAERSRFRLIALECYDRHQANLELERDLLKRILDYLFGKADAKSAAVASLTSKVLITISVSVSVTAAVGAGVHYHVVNRFRPAPRPPSVAPAPATTATLPPPTPVVSVAPAATVTTVPVDAHKQPIPAPTADSQKHNSALHAAAKKDNHLPAQDAHKAAGISKTAQTPKAAHTPKTEDAQKNDFASLLKKGGLGATAETEKEAATPAKNTDTEESANNQTNTTPKKKGGGLFGFLKKNKDKKEKTDDVKTNTNDAKTNNGKAENDNPATVPNR